MNEKPKVHLKSTNLEELLEYDEKNEKFSKSIVTGEINEVPIFKNQGLTSLDLLNIVVPFTIADAICDISYHRSHMAENIEAFGQKGIENVHAFKSNYRCKIPEYSNHFRCKLEQLLNTCRRCPSHHRSFLLMDQGMMASFRCSGIQKLSDHKTLLSFCLRMSCYVGHTGKHHLYRFLRPLCTLMNFGHCIVSLKMNWRCCTVSAHNQ